MRSLERLPLARRLLAGGRYRPAECRAVQRVAIVIPYRRRLAHLIVLLAYLHRFLQQQELHYGLYVVEQEDGELFNRAALLNIGFVEAARDVDDAYQCFVSHDVDLVPLNISNSYTCAVKTLPDGREMLLAKHMSYLLDK